MMSYGMLLAMVTLSIGVILGLGLSNGGQGGTPDWPIVLAGLGLLVCELAVIGVFVRQREGRYGR